MKTGGLGGGNTLTGLNFEKKVDFHELIREMSRASFIPQSGPDLFLTFFCE